jgi:hypothetical protein
MKKILITILFALTITPMYASANSFEYDNIFNQEIPYVYDNTIIFTLNNLSFDSENNEIIIDYNHFNTNPVSTGLFWGNNNINFAIGNTLNVDYNENNYGFISSRSPGEDADYIRNIPNASYLIVINNSSWEILDIIPINFEYEPPSITQDIFTWLSNVVSGFIGIFVLLLSNNGAVSLIYSDATGLTIFGSLFLLGFGLVIVKFGFNWIVRLIRLRQ